MSKKILITLAILALTLVIVSIFELKNTRNVQSVCAIKTDLFLSGGLGLSKDAWEKLHKRRGTTADFIDYDGGNYSVIFLSGNTWHIERNFNKNRPTLEKAIKESKSLIPKDSQLVKKFASPTTPENTVYLYLSESLKERFGSDVWTNAKPGNFIVLYDAYNGRIARIIIAPGNNP
jgi:hypothetical protein